MSFENVYLVKKKNLFGVKKCKNLKYFPEKKNQYG